MDEGKPAKGMLREFADYVAGKLDEDVRRSPQGAGDRMMRRGLVFRVPQFA